MTTALCIGNGSSLPQWREYIEYNHWDIRICTKFQFREFRDIDYTAAADCKPVKAIMAENPEWTNRTITRQLWKLQYNTPDTQLLCPQSFTKGDVTGTLQVKWAIECGATHITTVAFDSLANSWRKDTVWPWLTDGSTSVDQYILKEQQLATKRERLMKTWSDQIRVLEQRHPDIEFQHRNIRE